jgi:two-component system, cell cycle sensor histidine kinase PleC
MIPGSTSNKSNSLMNEYASLLGDAVLRHRTRLAEHSARIEAELASKVKSEFIANMSHELRTPLNTIIGFSKLLAEQERRKLKTDDIVQYSQLINDAAGHLLAVINDILDISKIQSGKYSLNSNDIQIDEMLTSCLSSFQLMSQEAGVQLNRRIDAELPLVRGDVVKMRQIFTNLVSNAIKFTRPGGTITVTANRLSDGSTMIAVTDTGIGMTDEELRIAMMPFGQVDGGRSRLREGTGLGLPIAKSLVELHGGKLTIRSEKNAGTVVTTVFPSRHDVTATPRTGSGMHVAQN